MKIPCTDSILLQYSCPIHIGLFFLLQQRLETISMNPPTDFRIIPLLQSDSVGSPCHSNVIYSGIIVSTEQGGKCVNKQVSSLLPWQMRPNRALHMPLPEQQGKHMYIFWEPAFLFCSLWSFNGFPLNNCPFAINTCLDDPFWWHIGIWAQSWI